MAVKRIGDTDSMSKRRQYGTGSVYKRARDGRWVGTLEAGWTPTGKRRRITVTGKTEPDVRRKLVRKQEEIARSGAASVRGSAVTVKSWSDEWLTIIEHRVRPKTYVTNRTQVRRWIVPAIGARRITDLTPADVRKVAAACRQAGLAQNSILRAHRTLMKLLRDAAAEGHNVPPNVFNVEAPASGVSQREALTVPHAIAVLTEASKLDDGGSRYAVAFGQALRQGEALGLTWSALDFDTNLMAIEWQLQALNYVDVRDKARGFRLPDGYETRHLSGAFHLVRPKSKAGIRVVPMVSWTRSILLAWREIAPPNPHDLVWARPDGRPIDKAADTQQWYALQRAAGVQHRAGRLYEGHETRHTTATLLLEAGVDPKVITAIMGHSSIITARGYMHVNAAAATAALQKVEQRLHELPTPRATSETQPEASGPFGAL